MRQENLSFLYDNLKYLGFGDGGPLFEQLKQLIEKDGDCFQLYTEAYFDEYTKLEACLYFRKSDQHDMCFFNKYEALLRTSNEPDKDKRQTFYINKGSGVTFKEAFNLLSGRAVNKDLVSLEGEKYNAWIQINFDQMDLHNNHRMKQYRSQYGFDLEKTLERYPIREWQNEESRVLLIRSLRRGNLQLVCFDKSSKTEKMFIEANPRYKTINIFPATIKIPGNGDRKHGGLLAGEPTAATALETVDVDEELGRDEDLEGLEEAVDEREPAAAKSLVRKRVRK